MFSDLSQRKKFAKINVESTFRQWAVQRDAFPTGSSQQRAVDGLRNQEPGNLRWCQPCQPSVNLWSYLSLYFLICKIRGLESQSGRITWKYRTAYRSGIITWSRQSFCFTPRSYKRIPGPRDEILKCFPVVVLQETFSSTLFSPAVITASIFSMRSVT